MSEKKILIIAGDFVEDYELMVPYQVLQIIHEYEVVVACPGKVIGDKIQTSVHDMNPNYGTMTEKLGHKFTITENFNTIINEEYDGLYLPGGRSPEYLQYNRKLINLIKYFMENNKPICSVCHGPLLLLRTKMMNGKKISAFDSIKNDVLLSGAVYCDDDVVVDGNLVTGKSYLSHVQLLKEFIQLIEE